MVALGLLVAAATAQAGEVRVISAGAVKSIVTDLAQVYEKETGNKVVMAHRLPRVPTLPSLWQREVEFCCYPL
jgi:accessory colonization factor AcfC